MPVATVLLCVRNGEATLAGQLAALHAQDFDEPWELVLVDNGSTDASRRIARAWQIRLADMRVVSEPIRGLNRARNRGVLAARASLILCCDADDEVRPGWLREMVRALERDALVGGAVDPERINDASSPKVACLQRSELPTAFGVPFAIGANLGFHRRVFATVGGFDERFEIGSDDVDFCLCAHHHGFSIGFAPAAIVDYRIKASMRGVVRQRFAYGRGHERLVAKHARMGHVDGRPIQRWKGVAFGATRLLVKVPQLLSSVTRDQYLASAAFVSGRVWELCIHTNTHDEVGAASRTRP